MKEKQAEAVAALPANPHQPKAVTFSATERSMEQELASYLSEKGMQNLFSSLFEKLLVDRPENPVEYTVAYLMDAFPEETVKFHPVDVLNLNRVSFEDSMISEPDFAVSTMLPAGPVHRLRRDLDESMLSEPDVTVDDMLPRAPVHSSSTVTRFQTERRGSISAAPFTESHEDFSPVLHPKSQEDFATILTLLPKYWVTASLDTDAAQKIANAMTLQTFKKGDVIIRQGDVDASNYYLVKSGSCSVLEDDRLVHEVGEGDGFGELALLYNTPRMESVVATSEQVQVFILDRSSFRSIVVNSATERRERHIAFLSKVPLLASLEEKKLCTLADAMQLRTYAPGADVVLQDERGSEFFVIEKGSVEVFHDGERVGELGVGDYFGEIALLDSAGKRAATVRASQAEPLHVAFCRREVFHRVLGGSVANEMRKKIAHYKRTPKRVAAKSLLAQKN